MWREKCFAAAGSGLLSHGDTHGLQTEKADISPLILRNHSYSLKWVFLLAELVALSCVESAWGWGETMQTFKYTADRNRLVAYGAGKWSRIATRQCGNSSLENPRLSQSPPLPQISLPQPDRRAWGFCSLCCMICTEGRSCLFSSMQHLWFEILLTTLCCSRAAGLSVSPERTWPKEKEQRRAACRPVDPRFFFVPLEHQKMGRGGGQPFLYQHRRGVFYYEAILSNEGQVEL